VIELRDLDGRYVGDLTDEELRLFIRAEKNAQAVRVYRGTAGLLGISKVRVIYDTNAADDSSRGE
jgi:hypothetical protein